MLCSECMYHLDAADQDRPDDLIICPECGHRTTANMLRFVWRGFLKDLPPIVPDGQPAVPPGQRPPPTPRDS